MSHFLHIQILNQNFRSFKDQIVRTNDIGWSLTPEKSMVLMITNVLNFVWTNEFQLSVIASTSSNTRLEIKSYPSLLFLFTMPFKRPNNMKLVL